MFLAEGLEFVVTKEVIQSAFSNNFLPTKKTGFVFEMNLRFVIDTSAFCCFQADRRHNFNVELRRNLTRKLTKSKNSVIQVFDYKMICSYA